MDRNRSRYERHKKYLGKKSNSESRAEVLDDQLIVSPASETRKSILTNPSHEPNSIQTITEEKGTLRMRFHKTDLPDLSVSQSQQISESITSSSPNTSNSAWFVESSENVSRIDESVQMHIPLRDEDETMAHSSLHSPSASLIPDMNIIVATTTTNAESSPENTTTTSQSALRKRFSLSTAFQAPSLVSQSSEDHQIQQQEALECHHDSQDSGNSSRKAISNKISHTKTSKDHNHSHSLSPFTVSEPNLISITSHKPRANHHDRDHSVSSITAVDTVTVTSDSCNSSSILTLRNEPAAVIIPNAAGVYRPTEAQLRWAQFHQKERSRKTQLRVERLMNTPLLSIDIPGIMSGDDDSYTSYEDLNENSHNSHAFLYDSLSPSQGRKKKKALGIAKKTKNKNIPNLSVGRRVLLRISARRTHQRRLMIIEHGYSMEPDSDDGGDGDSIQDENNIRRRHNHENETVAHSLKDGSSIVTDPSSNSGLTASLTGSSIIGLTVSANKPRRAKKKTGTPHLKGRKSIVSTADENEGRIRRFEEAHSALFNAILSLQQASSNPMDEIDRDQIKRWTRASHISPAISIDGREYYDLQRGPSIKYDKKKNPSLYELIDKGATWLMHLPKQDKINFITMFLAENKPDVIAGQSELDDVSNLGQERLLELIQQLQLYSNNESKQINDLVQPEKSVQSERDMGQEELMDDRSQNLNPSFSSSQRMVQMMDNNPESSSPTSSSTSKKLPPIYRGPVARDKIPQSVPSDTDVLMKISGWYTDNESSDEPYKNQYCNDRNDKEGVQVETPIHDQAQLTLDNCNLGTDDNAVGTSHEQTQSTLHHSNICIDEHEKIHFGSEDDGEFQNYSDRELIVMSKVISWCKNNGASDDNTQKDDDPAEEVDEKLNYNFSASDEDQSANEDISFEDMEASLRFSHTFIDTDQASDVCESAGVEDRIMIGSLMLTPEILNKRLHQAISSIQMRNWDHVFYLLSANPWLAEMTEMVSKQYLLHILALHGGASAIDSNDAAPADLNEHLIQMFPSAAQKFDGDGNLPLHHAALSLNDDMVSRLLQRFPSGVSVQNNDGHLPLHLSILALSSNSSPTEGNLFLMEKLLNIFPGSLSVQDNEGNLPVHLGASHLTGDTAINVLSTLLRKTDQEAISLRVPRKIRRKDYNPLLSEHITIDVIESSESECTEDIIISIYNVKNREGFTPLMCAFQRNCDWQVIQIFLGSKINEEALLSCVDNGKTLLERAIESCFNASTILLIIKICPQLVRIRDMNGFLPIEAICSRSDLPQKVFVAMVLVDIPVHESADSRTTPGYKAGASWWWINCECDDLYVHIVRQILSMTTARQKRQICRDKDKNGVSIIARATPACRKELQKALRFAGKYELLRDLHDELETSTGVKIFEALDFTRNDVVGSKVLLKCYSNQHSYMNDVCLFDGVTMRYDLLEENEAFIVDDSPHRFCISTEFPTMSLASYVDELKAIVGSDKLPIPAIKSISSILHQIGKSIEHLHRLGIIHGAVSITSVGCFGPKWKLTNLAGSRPIKCQFEPYRLCFTAPPETVETVVNMQGSSRYYIRNNVAAASSIDIWAFGKLCYELLSSQHLIKYDTHQYDRYLAGLANWSDDRLLKIIHELEKSAAGPLAADLVSHCLSYHPYDRPRDMTEILSHSFWRAFGANESSR